MVNVNHVIVAGNLTKDPELHYTPSGAAVCTLSIAVNRRYKSKTDEQKEEVSFFDAECWAKTAEIAAQHLHKGRGVILEGRIKQDRWEAPEGGNRSRVVIVADSVQFLGPPKDGQGSPVAAPQAAGEIDFDA